MRSLWRGSISFGLVNIPVKLYAATEDRGVHFRQLHEPCHTPIQYRKYCPTCAREVEPEEIQRGYEYTRGQFVIVEPEELEALPEAEPKTVEILDFVRLDEIDPIYYDKTYFLEPDGGQKAYALLRQAMLDTGRIGIGRVVIRARASLAAIRVLGGDILAMETMHYPDEVRDYHELEGVGKLPAATEREMEMARDLIGRLSVPFDPGRYEDEYRAALLELIEGKVQGREIARAPGPRPEPVTDLVAALEESLRQVGVNRERTLH